MRTRFFIESFPGTFRMSMISEEDFAGKSFISLSGWEGIHIVELASARSARKHKAWGVSPRIGQEELTKPARATASEMPWQSQRLSPAAAGSSFLSDL